ncbi:NmrA family NAD(P)-binding protein [Hymenobacter coalescens]
MNILVTGATGHVGLATLRALSRPRPGISVVAGVRNPAADSPALAGLADRVVPFDFEREATFAPALQGTDVLFLLRPPALADVARYFAPLIQAAKAAQVRHIVFLSVQGVERNSLIPHHKIEQLISASGLAYTFLRPAYFMQNFTSSLRDDLTSNHLIFLPAGQAKFTLVDVDDVGRVAAQVLADSPRHAHKSYDLTSHDQLTFGEMAAELSRTLGRPIRFESPNLLRFYLTKRRQGLPSTLILVMILLHYLPRLQPTPPTSDWVETITGRVPTSFAEFVAEHRSLLQ